MSKSKSKKGKEDKQKKKPRARTQEDSTHREYAHFRVARSAERCSAETK